MKLPIVPLVVLAVLVPATARAADDRCPIESLDLAVIEKGIKDAPGCDAALSMFKTCSVGAGGDVGLGAAVTEKCEALFDGKLSAPQKSAYSRARHACERKYARESGTMYRSFEAFCLAQAAHRTARPFFQPAATKAPDNKAPDK
jgi:hypothetical protein